MRVVHDHQKRLTHINALEAPGDAFQILEALLDDFIRKAKSLGGANCGEQVVDVDPSDEPRLHPQFSLGRMGGETQPLETKLKFACGDVRLRFQAILHRSEEHTSELQSRFDLVCRLLLEKKKKKKKT